VWAVAFSLDGWILATVGAKGRAYLWDVATGGRTATVSGLFTGEPAGSVAFSWGGTILAVPDRSDGASGGGGLDSVVFSPDGHSPGARAPCHPA
jgi:WD40 repeat protein